MVTITDLMEHEINYSRTALSVTMKEGKEIERKNLRVSNDQVGEPSFHEIVFYPPAFIYPGYFISLYIPEQFQVPMPSEFSCEVASPLSNDNLDCQINGNRVTLVVKIDPSNAFDYIEDDEEIWIKIGPIGNPGSCAPTDSYAIEVKTDQYDLSTQADEGLFDAITLPARIQQASFSALDARQLATTTITVEWVNTQIYPASASIEINYDHSQIGPVFDDPSVPEVDCIFSRTTFVRCEYDIEA